MFLMCEVPLYERIFGSHDGVATQAFLEAQPPRITYGIRRYIPTLHERAAVPRRARIQGSSTFVSLNPRLGSKKEKKKRGHPYVPTDGLPCCPGDSSRLGYSRNTF